MHIIFPVETYLDSRHYRPNCAFVWRSSSEGSGIVLTPLAHPARGHLHTPKVQPQTFHFQTTITDAQTHNYMAGSSKLPQSISLGKKRKHQHLSDVFDSGNIAEQDTKDKDRKTTKKCKPNEVQKSVKDYCQSRSSEDLHTHGTLLGHSLPDKLIDFRFQLLLERLHRPTLRNTLCLLLLKTKADFNFPQTSLTGMARKLGKK